MAASCFNRARLWQGGHVPLLIREAASQADYDAFGRVIRAYVEWCRERYSAMPWLVDLAFGYQALDQELTELAAKYGPPQGRILLAFEDGHLAGGVAYRRLSESICEMKRMFVFKEHAGRGIGRQLCRRLIAEAAAAGFSTMRLDTSRDMREAIALYRSAGFAACAPYIDYPERLKPMILFMELALSARG